MYPPLPIGSSRDGTCATISERPQVPAPQVTGCVHAARMVSNTGMPLYAGGSSITNVVRPSAAKGERIGKPNTPTKYRPPLLNVWLGSDLYRRAVLELKIILLGE